MKTLEMKKIIKARSNGIVKNYSKISNIIWTEVNGIGVHRSNYYDDYIVFDYNGKKYLLESKYTGEHSAKMEHNVIEL